MQSVPPCKSGHGVSKDNLLRKEVFFFFSFLEKKPKLAGIFTRILLIILVNPPKKELFAYLLLLFAVSLMEMEGWDGTDLCKEETKQGFRSAKPPSGALNHHWDFRLSVEG